MLAYYKCYILIELTFLEKGSDYCCIASLISKNETINLIQNANLTDKSRTL